MRSATAAAFEEFFDNRGFAKGAFDRGLFAGFLRMGVRTGLTPWEEDGISMKSVGFDAIPAMTPAV